MPRRRKQNLTQILKYCNWAPWSARFFPENHLPFASIINMQKVKYYRNPPENISYDLSKLQLRKLRRAKILFMLEFADMWLSLQSAYARTVYKYTNLQESFNFSF